MISAPTLMSRPSSSRACSIRSAASRSRSPASASSRAGGAYRPRRNASSMVSRDAVSGADRDGENSPRRTNPASIAIRPPPAAGRGVDGDDLAAADGDHRGVAAEDKRVAAGHDGRPLEPQLPHAGLPGTEPAPVEQAEPPDHLVRPGVHADPFVMAERRRP